MYTIPYPLMLPYTFRSVIFFKFGLLGQSNGQRVISDLWKKLKNTLILAKKWRFYDMAGSKSSLLIDSPIMCKGKELAFIKEWLTSEAEGCKTKLNNVSHRQVYVQE